MFVIVFIVLTSEHENRSTSCCKGRHRKESEEGHIYIKSLLARQMKVNWLLYF